MSNVRVYRHQYGVGQGCFHAQELSFGDEDRLRHTFRFVYDCGSSTSQDSLKWCISHFEKGIEDKVVHAAYLSHFEDDHINGLEALCQKVDVQRVYVPHIDPEKVLHIVAQQLASGVSWSKKYENFLANVLTVANGGRLFDVPVTMITDGPQPAGNDDPTLVDNAEPGSYNVNMPTAATVTHSTRVTVSAVHSLDNAVRSQIVWEVVPWYFGADDALTVLILGLIAALPGFTTSLVPGLQPNATSKQVDIAIAWMKAKHVDIADAYGIAMDYQNAERLAQGLYLFPKNHNVASLCVYSGPIKRNAMPQNYQTFPALSYPPCWFCSPHSGFFFREHAGAWIATGDALLEVPDIWDEFEAHFSPVRLNCCSTVLVPHHGAGANSSNNYNEALIRVGQNCVVSAGMRGGYRHPHRNIVQHILEKPANLQLVTESQTIGFIEHLKIDLGV